MSAPRPPTVLAVRARHAVALGWQAGCAVALGWTTGLGLLACGPTDGAAALGPDGYVTVDAGIDRPLSPLPRMELETVIPPPVVKGMVAFGSSAALWGDWMLAVSPLEDVEREGIVHPNAGTVHSYRRVAGAWQRMQMLERPDVRAGEGLFSLTLPWATLPLPAYALVMHGTEAFVGLVTDDHGAGAAAAAVAPNSGAVHVYRRSDGVYEHLQVLKAPSPSAEDHFGYRIAVSGPWLAISAVSEDSGPGGDDQDTGKPDSGAVYMFVRRRSGWTFHSQLKALNADAGDRFGSSLVMKDDLLMVGAMFESSGDPGTGSLADNGVTRSGAVYQYRLRDDSWRFTDFLKAPRPTVEDAFGMAMALDGDRLVVGAPAPGRAADPSLAVDGGPRGGSAFIFRWGGARWEADGSVSVNNPTALFGVTLGLRGPALFVGAPGQSTDALFAGAVRVFHRGSEGWAPVDSIEPGDGSAEDGFGAWIALGETRVAVSAPAKAFVSPSRTEVPRVGRIYMYRY